ncbi:MAG: hypothetical protein ACKORK_10845, partial [Gemmatimonadota bacterium]
GAVEAALELLEAERAAASAGADERGAGGVRELRLSLLMELEAVAVEAEPEVLGAYLDADHARAESTRVG